MRVASDTNLGDPSGGLTLDGGELVDQRRLHAPLVPSPSDSQSREDANILAAATNTTATYTGVIIRCRRLSVGDINNRAPSC